MFFLIGRFFGVFVDKIQLMHSNSHSAESGDHTMYLSKVVQESREIKVNQVMAATGCSRDYAISYLYAEEWHVGDAVISYKGDRMPVEAQA